MILITTKHPAAPEVSVRLIQQRRVLATVRAQRAAAKREAHVHLASSTLVKGERQRGGVGERSFMLMVKRGGGWSGGRAGSKRGSKRVRRRSEGGGGLALHWLEA
jgi:hypothetical protein